MGMTRFWPLAALWVLAAGIAGGTPAAADTRTMAQSAEAFEASAQERRRQPPRITVRPRRYPPGYLDPRAVRHCMSWLEPEHRPSGTVIVPQMRCWWVPPS